MTEIVSMVERQRAFFASLQTKDYAFRREMLQRLDAAIRQYEKTLTDALWTDLHKSYEEAYLTELSIVYAEIRDLRRHLKRWMRPVRKCTPPTLFPARSRILTEPLGNALIIAPWNYPVQLLLNPLAGAMAAGCTAMLKPSPYTPHVSAVLTKMIRETFSDAYIGIVEGHREVNAALLEQRWDVIFFTGSPALGKTVLSAAARFLTPAILELGGKSPCIIDKDARLEVAARRVAWGKSLNAGQTCIAPDYLLLHKDIEAEFLHRLQQEFTNLLGIHPQESPHFARIVSDRAFERLRGYLQDGTVYYGGQNDPATRYFAPTILTGVKPDAPVMQEEIFGPLFPVMVYSTLDEALDFVRAREKPLALYYFGKEGGRVLHTATSGGACINDTVMHIANSRLPFGGVGHSGMSAYHGYNSYLAFSHRRAVVQTPTAVDMPFRYMPYRFFRWIKRLL